MWKSEKDFSEKVGAELAALVLKAKGEGIGG
jgi:hypothetical protein